MDIKEHMTHETTQNKTIKIAAPYYGALSHPTRGLSNLYFLMDIVPGEKKVAGMHVTVWNPAESGELSSWLKNAGVQTLVCNAIENCHHHELQETGIQVESVTGSDILQGITSWLSNLGADMLKPVDPVPAFNY